MDPVAHHRAQLATSGCAVRGRVTEATGIRLEPAALVDALVLARPGRWPA